VAGRKGNETLPALASSGGTDEVGYGKPPKHSRFQPGQSGNPRGRPRGSKNKRDVFGLERLKSIVLEEAYREIPVADGGTTKKMPIAQAIVRTMAVKAAKGDHRSQRLFSEMLWEIEGDQLEENRDKLMTAVHYKEQWGEELQRCQEQGLEPPLLLPHPNDVCIDGQTGEVTVTGPVTLEQKEIWELGFEQRTIYEALTALLEEQLSQPLRKGERAKLDERLHRYKDHLQMINQILPDERYEQWSKRYPASGELVEIQARR
jgi:hypothetical protein